MRGVAATLARAALVHHPRSMSTRGAAAANGMQQASQEAVLNQDTALHALGEAQRQGTHTNMQDQGRTQFQS